MPSSSKTPDPANQPALARRDLTARFWRTASGYWRPPGASGAWILTAVLVGVTVLQLALQYRLNYWSRDFFDAFGRRDGPVLQAEAWIFLILAGSSILVAILSVWARMTTQRKWREWLTRLLLDRWLVDKRFHQLHFPPSEDENPEFRIAEDARVATEAPVNLATGFLTALLSAIVFIGVLWNVGGDLDVLVLGYMLTIPKYLVLTVMIYSALLTLGMTFIGRRMTHVIERKNAAEAEFRSVAISMREIAAAKPKAGDAPAHRHLLSEAFNNVVRRWRNQCFQVMRTTFMSHGNLLAAPVIGWLLCAPKYMVDTMTLGEAAQVVAAFVMVQTALNWLVDNYAGLAECLSSVQRVASLLLALDEIKPESVRTS